MPLATAPPAAVATARREIVKRPHGAVTMVYAAGGRRLTSIEDELCIVDVLYDEGGAEVGRSVHPRGRGLALTVRNTNDRHIPVDGLPPLDRSMNADGRDAEVRAGNKMRLAQYLYRP